MGGGPDIPLRSFQEEWPQIKQGFKGQESQYAAFRNRDPLLKQLYGAASSIFGEPLPSATLATSPVLSELQSQALSELKSGGRLSPQEARTIEQQTLADFGQRGNVLGPQAIASDVLNRDIYRTQKLRGYQQFAGGVEGLTQAQEALGQSQQRLRMAGQQQKFQLPESVVSTGVGAYTALTNPILSYMQDLFSSNQNAQATQSIAGANKSSGALGGGIGAIGQIAGAALPLIAASDERLKERIMNTDEKTLEGIPIKTFSFKTDPEKRRWVGVMAQDVAKKVPEAVLTDVVSGVQLVDYSKIDAPFHEIARRKAA